MRRTEQVPSLEVDNQRYISFIADSFGDCFSPDIKVPERKMSMRALIDILKHPSVIYKHPESLKILAIKNWLEYSEEFEIKSNAGDF
jgi:hypothetical protein